MRRLLPLAPLVALLVWAPSPAVAAVPPVTAGPLHDDGRPTASPGLIADATPTFTATGEAALECSLVAAGAAVAWQDCSTGVFSPLTPLPDGIYVFSARSVTPTGTATAATRTFTIDTIAPAAPVIDAPLEGSTVPGAASFAFRTEPAAGLSCSLDGAPYAPCAGAGRFAFVPDGPHTLRVRSTDAAGNTSEPAPRRFAVDATAPVVTVTSPAEAATTARAVQFDFAASEPGVTYRCRVDLGREFACGPGYARTNLTPGEHRFRVGATDAIGNVGPMADRRFRVAATAEDEIAPEPDPTDLAGVLGADGSTRAALAALRIDRLFARRAVTRRGLRARGLRVRFQPPAGMAVARVRVLRGTRRVMTTFRAVRGRSPALLVVRTRSVRRLRPGRYRIEVTPGLSRTRLGSPARRLFRVLR